MMCFADESGFKSLPVDSTVPIDWIAVGSPASILALSLR